MSKYLRKIDALVTEHVMGFDVDCFVPDDEPAPDEARFPPYSADITAAWGVVERLRLGIEPSYMPGKWYCWAPGKKTDRAVADTAPLAICLAALHALGVEVEEDV